MDGQRVDFNFLPSRGIKYPDDIEIYVSPLPIKEQIDMERYGISDAEYFQILLNGITIHGNFNKNNLLHSDVQFMDIVRRLYTFDTDDAITIKDYECPYRDCDGTVDFSFKINEIEFTDFNEDIFGKEFVLREGTEDEVTVVVSPLTSAEYIAMSKKFQKPSRKDALSSMYTDYLCACIREIKDREFRNERERDAFLKGLIENTCMAKHKKVFKQIVEESIVKVKPFITYCPECGRQMEVEVRPTSNFQQE
mgnify:CR=1 FL=1